MLKSNKNHTRESWLVAMKKFMAPRFSELGYELPEKIDIYFGFGYKNNAKCIGRCYDPVNTVDGYTPIVILPTIWESTRVAGTLCHELIHAIGKPFMNHGRLFGKACTELGLIKPWTATTESDEFKKWVQPFIDEHGEFPHKERWAEQIVKKRGAGEKIKFQNLRCLAECYMMKVPVDMFKAKRPCCPICDGKMLTKQERAA